ncbi:MAG: ATP-binding cassette domain-containing protein [Candidatus Latescibacteria bacterium]|nr:ATP-binding cassette domain-containing protein [Candidatus Latescibacterota bacterium]
MHNDALVIENVCKHFNGIRAVNNLSARLPSGCIYGFLGPNGAGKTTTIRMIMNIIQPDSGSITIFGNSSIEKAKNNIGYMPEERGLYRKMTVRSIISYIGAIKNMKRTELSQAVPHWLGELGLQDWADKKVEDLSRGMQQKLQFVATVINDPTLLILDEPFSGLDPINLDLLKGIMLKMRENGKTVVFSTHMMEHAEKLCDFILLINKGEKVIDGPLDQIRANFTSNVVSIELEGDTGFIGKLPIVKDTKKVGKRLEITLDEKTDHQELLHNLIGKSRIRAFEVKSPSLHEIFIQMVGEKK